ncbi:MAG: hypothetical protein HXK63_07845 [Campylobacter sp.]|nr:hypothetical protein [Campylobacter sp.]
MSFFTRRGFKFYSAPHRLFDMLRLCLLGTPSAADAALMKYMASACLVLFVERGFGAGRMAVCSAPMYRCTMSVRHRCCLLGVALMPFVRCRVLFTLRAKSF